MWMTSIPTLSRSVALKFGACMGAQRLIVTVVEAAEPASPFESSGSAPTWYVPSYTYVELPVGATHLFWLGDPEVVSMVGVPIVHVNDHALPEPLQLVFVGGHVSSGLPSISHDM